MTVILVKQSTHHAYKKQVLQATVEQEEDAGCLYKIAVSHSLADLCRCLSEFDLSPAHADKM